jgi:amidase
VDELTYFPATKLIEMIHTKTVSSVEVVQAHLNRIEQINPKINSVVQVLVDSALRRANLADEALSRGDSWGPLHGLPMTTKDAIEMAGTVTTGGTKGRTNHIPIRDATVISRLLDAGAVILGNTNVPELCLADESDNLIYGRTNNPYDLSRAPGGSSGGEAATIASGGSPVGLGSDVGGSIRGPAHFCGIAGIKPTTGRVPTTGHWPPFGGLFAPMSQIGPMARYVEDLALVLPVLSGMDGHDSYVAPAPLLDMHQTEIRSTRVAFFTDSGGLEPDADTKKTVRNALEVLRKAGASVTEARPTGFENGHDLVDAILAADGGSTVRKLLKEAGTTELHPFTGTTGWPIDESTALSGPQFAELLAKKDSWRSGMLSFMEDYDAVLSPVWAYPAVPHGTVAKDWPQSTFTHQYNLTGWPAAVVRAGTSTNGLPIGIQVATPPWREDVALALTYRIEQELGGWQPPPL